jgi:hypothetical protein
MWPDASLGPVAHGAQVQEVLHDPEATLDLDEGAIGTHDLRSGRLGGAERGDQHIATGQELLVGEGGLVVVVEEVGPLDLDLEEPGDGGRTPGCAGQHGRSWRDP